MMRCASHVGGELSDAFECATRMGPVEIRGTIHEPLKGRMLKNGDNTRRVALPFCSRFQETELT
jgi:hypothetical protein